MPTTAERLLEATTCLLVEQGPTATTLRAITERADANVAAVGYHFGSKDALVTQAYAAILDEVTRLQLARLAELPEDADLQAVVRIWLSPAFAVGEESVRESALWTAVHRGMAEQAPGMLEHQESVAAVEEQLHRRLRRLLPHLSDSELRFRHAATLAGLSSLRSGPLQQLWRIDSDESALLDLAVAWVAGGLQAPAGAVHR
jgi:AcrR family transcriptional regulator